MNHSPRKGGLRLLKGTASIANYRVQKNSDRYSSGSTNIQNTHEILARPVKEELQRLRSEACEWALDRQVLQSEIGSNEATIQEYRKNLENLEAENNRLRQEAIDVRLDGQAQAAMEKELESLRDELGVVSHQFEIYRVSTGNDMEHLQLELTEIEGRWKEADSECKMLHSNLKSCEEKVEEKSEHIERLVNSLSQMEDDLKMERQENEDMQARFQVDADSKNAQLLVLSSKIRTLDEDVQALQYQLLFERDEHARLLGQDCMNDFLKIEKLDKHYQAIVANLESQISGLEHKLDHEKDNSERSKHEEDRMRASMREMEMQLVDYSNVIEKLRIDISENGKRSALVSAQSQLSAKETENLRSDIKTSHQQIISLTKELESCRSSLDEAQCAYSKANYDAAMSRVELENSRMTISSLEGRNREVEAALRTQAGLEAEAAARRCAELQRDIGALQELLINESQQRRKLLLELQIIKGNIRVVTRIRPGSDATSQLAVKGNTIVTGQHRFSFDRVFGPDTSNGQVYDEIEYLVTSALDGRRVCIFAYGQTGSGKTYTMSSKDGIIERSLQTVCSVKQESTVLTAEFVEIYNETIVDLLASQNSNQMQKICIQRNSNGELQLAKNTRVRVTSCEQALALIAEGQRRRSVAATKCNERSSRSHSVFILNIEQRDPITGQQVSRGALTLVDLAGSERLTHSQVTGERLRETQNINKSLSCLGDVIHALVKRPRTHIPFRNSKLTFLLQDSLSGDSMAVMLLHLAPEPQHMSETISTLRFGSKVTAAKLKR